MGFILPNLEQLVRQILEQGFFKDQISGRLMLICWIMLVTAAVIWIILGRTKKGYEITSMYWLSCGLGIRLCLFLPPQNVILASLLVISGISFLFALLPIWSQRRFRKKAWPNHLERLSSQYKPPGGLLTSITAFALLVFFLSLCYVTSANAARSCFLMAVSLLVLVQYDYRAESALAGMVLMSLAVVSAFLDLVQATGKSSPVILSLVIIPLAYLAFHWVWLGKIWSRQILDSKPLTTSARMVHLTRHVGVMFLGFSTLLGVKLSLWPLMPAAVGPDNGSGRFFLLVVAFLFLLGANGWMCLNLRIPSLFALAVLNLFSAGVAFVTRTPKFFHEIFQPNWMAFSLGYMVVIILGAILLRRWREKMTDR